MVLKWMSVVLLSNCCKPPFPVLQQSVSFVSIHSAPIYIKRCMRNHQCRGHLCRLSVGLVCMIPYGHDRPDGSKGVPKELRLGRVGTMENPRPADVIRCKAVEEGFVPRLSAYSCRCASYRPRWCAM